MRRIEITGKEREKGYKVCAEMVGPAFSRYIVEKEGATCMAYKECSKH